MSKTEVVKGFKVFNPDWTCRGKTYTCPGKFEENITQSTCKEGIHFCKNAADCFNYYRFDPENKVAEVVAYGMVAEDGDKCCTDKIEIVREIPWTELLEIVNSGKNCTGLCNSGDRNSGSCNSGSWNKCSFSNGCFNTINPKIYLFNKPSEWTYQDWIDSEARYLLNRNPVDMLEYVYLSDMTEEEKESHPEAEITGGYLKILDNSERAVIWWRGISEHEKAVIKAIPNFDKEIFKEITGIDVDEY